jgi:hypothetical protein
VIDNECVSVKILTETRSIKIMKSNYYPTCGPEGSADGSDDFDDSKTDIEEKIVCESF